MASKPSSAVPFRDALLNRVLELRTNETTDNYDAERFGPLARESSAASPGSRLRQALKAVFPTPIYARRVEPYRGLQFLHERLETPACRALLVDLIAYRILGWRRVMLPTNTPAFNDRKARLATLAGEYSLSAGFQDWKLRQFDLNPLGVPISLFSTATGLHEVFVLEQYRYTSLSGECAAQPGDVVIDAGSCWGDTPLYFAHRVGPTGRVFGFEFLPSNLAIMQRNLALNPQLARCIEVVEHPVWSTSDQPLYYLENGPGSRVGTEPFGEGGGQVTTLSIDDLVTRKGLSRVDFIKMDVEGAEMAALDGASGTIREFHPKLAISVYHRPDDLELIPQAILKLYPSYRLFLAHYTIHHEETVLYAIPA